MAMLLPTSQSLTTKWTVPKHP